MKASGTLNSGPDLIPRPARHAPTNSSANFGYSVIKCNFLPYLHPDHIFGADFRPCFSGRGPQNLPDAPGEEHASIEEFAVGEIRPRIRPWASRRRRLTRPPVIRPRTTA